MLRTILNELDLENDIFISEGILDVLDHSAPEPLFGAKIGSMPPEGVLMKSSGQVCVPDRCRPTG